MLIVREVLRKFKLTIMFVEPSVPEFGVYFGIEISGCLWQVGYPSLRVQTLCF